jgi:hypothetical protein
MIILQNIYWLLTVNIGEFTEVTGVGKGIFSVEFMVYLWIVHLVLNWYLRDRLYTRLNDEFFRERREG